MPFGIASLNLWSMASFLFSLGAKLQFKRSSGVLSRSKGYQGSGKFCLLQGLNSARAGLTTTLRTPINSPELLTALRFPSQVPHSAPLAPTSAVGPQYLLALSEPETWRQLARGLSRHSPLVNSDLGARALKPPSFGGVTSLCHVGLL